MTSWRKTKSRPYQPMLETQITLSYYCNLLIFHNSSQIIVSLHICEGVMSSVPQEMLALFLPEHFSGSVNGNSLLLQSPRF